MDADTNIAVSEIYSLDAVRVNLAYLDQLKRLFTEFLHVNLNVGKLTVSWRDIEEKGTTMIARSFLKLCRYKHLIPAIMNVEGLHEFVEQTLPPITNGEYDFYEKCMLQDAYDQDKNYQTTMVEPMVNEKGEPMEPALHFHEFVFLMGLIARKCISSETDSIQTKLQEFYTKTLNFKKVKIYTYDEIVSIKEFKVKDNGLQQEKEVEKNQKDKNYLRTTLQDFSYEDVLKLQSTEHDPAYDLGESGEEEEWSSEEEEVMELVDRQRQQEASVAIDWEGILAVLDSDLPKIPARPDVE